MSLHDQWGGKTEIRPLPVRGENHINYRQLLTGIAGLCLGTLIYLSDRAPEATYLTKVWLRGISLHDHFSDLFGAMDRNLASFLHSFSFTMISAGVMAESRKGCFKAALLWCFVDALFEIGQYFDTFVAKLVPDAFDNIFFLETVRDYFLVGTFDPYDLVAVFAGAWAGYWMACITLKTSIEISIETSGENKSIGTEK